MERSQSVDLVQAEVSGLNGSSALRNFANTSALLCVEKISKRKGR